MANNDIRQKIVLEGEQQYNQALKEAQRNLKTLRSALKAETAELGKNATEQQKNETRAKSLQKQIQEQEKIVKTLREALKSAKDQYGNNADVIAKWEQKLNDARATLGNMKNELDGLGDGFKSVENGANLGIIATKNLADSFASIASIGESVSSTIESIFSGVANTVKETAAMIFGEVTDLAARANNLTDLAGYWNTDPVTIQKWQNAVKSSANNIEDLNQVVQKINLGDSKKITELVNVSASNYADKWEYAMAVMDSMSKMDYNARENAAEIIFGQKGTTKAYDLLNDWEDITNLLSRFDSEQGGLGMTNEQIETFNEVSVKLATIETTWQELKRQFEAGILGEVSLKVSSNAQGILDSLIAYMGSDNEANRAKAISDLQSNLTEFFTGLGEAIQAAGESLEKVGQDLQGSENGYVKTMGNIVEKLGELMEWLSNPESIDALLKAFERLAEFWIAGKGLQMLNNIGSMVLNLKNILGLGAADAAAAGATAGASWGSAFAAAVLKAAPWLAGIYTLVNPSNTSDAIGNNTLVDANGNLTAEAIHYGYTKDENGDITVELPKDVAENIWKTSVKNGTAQLEMTDEQWKAAQEFWDVYRANPGDSDSWDAAWDSFEAAFADQVEIFDKLNELWGYWEQSNNWDDSVYSIEDLPSSWFKEMGGNSGETNGLTSDDISGFRSVPGLMRAAVREGVAGIRVNLDGKAVGDLVAPYISQKIASDIG